MQYLKQEENLFIMKILYYILKEEDKEKPYFALKVDNTDVLVAGENN